MKNIEKVLYNSIVGKQNPLSEKELFSYMDLYGEELLYVLFKMIRELVENYIGDQEIDFSIPVFYLHTMISTLKNIDKKKLKRQILKLEERMSQIQLEKKKDFVDTTKVDQEFHKLEQMIENVDEICKVQSMKQYEFVEYLIEEVRNLTYLDYMLQKFPSFINIKDEKENSLFYNTIKKYITSIQEAKEESVFYYRNLISYFKNQKDFELEYAEQKKILELIYRAIDQFSYKKKVAKKNSEKLKWLYELKNLLVPENKSQPPIEEIAFQYHIPITFDESLEEYVYQCSINEDNENMREVLDDYIITIDKKGTSEIDDGLSCQKMKNGNYLLGVHIANILGYFPYNHPLIEHSFERGQTIYLTRKYQEKSGEFQKFIPIFPPEIATNLASLVEKEPRFARSFYFEITKEGEIINQKFPKTIITSQRQMTYQEVNYILEHGHSNIKLCNTIQNLYEVSTILNKQYQPLDLYEKVKKNKIDSSELILGESAAEKIVSSCMLLTGSKVADFFAHSSRGYPCIYRVHEIDEKTSKKIESMIQSLRATYGKDQFKKLYRLISGIYPKGWYDLQGGHTGLGLKHYCHCTSGLRRSQDNIVEHALEICYDKEPTDKELQSLEEDIQKKIIMINAKNKTIDWFLNDYEKSYRKKR